MKRLRRVEKSDKVFPISRNNFVRIRNKILKIVKQNLPDQDRRMDYDSEMWSEATRENLNLFLSFLRRGQRGFDLGCGKGFNTALLQHLGLDMLGLDLPQTSGEQLGFTQAYWQEKAWGALEKKFGPKFIYGDARNLPPSLPKFDFILAYAVFEHIEPNKESLPVVLGEIKKILKNSAYLFIADLPRTQAYLESLAEFLGLPSHDNRFTEEMIVTLLNNVGFKILYLDTYGMVPFHLHPVTVQKIANKICKLFIFGDKVLMKTPLRKYSHHIRVVARNIS